MVCIDYVRNKLKWLHMDKQYRCIVPLTDNKYCTPSRYGYSNAVGKDVEL